MRPSPTQRFPRGGRRSVCGQVLTSSADDELGLGLGRALGDVDHVRDPVLALPTFRDGRRSGPWPLAAGAGRWSSEYAPCQELPGLAGQEAD
jgi:hypothetical protein